VNNVRHGKGILRRADGSVYDGDWENDVESGIGKMRWLNGDEYEG